MTSDTVWQIVRYLLIALGTGFVQKGYINNDTLTTIVSACGTLFIAGWGIYVKLGTRATTADHADKVSTPVVSPVTGSVSTQ